MATLFQQKVWDTCAKIPCGMVSTYAEIAMVIGKPKSSRAVGNSLNQNPFPKNKVPCHRVVLSSGKVGGYAHGTKKKIQLLEKEGVKIEKGKVVNLVRVLFQFQ